MNKKSKAKTKKRMLAVLVILFIVMVTLLSNTAFINKLKSTFSNKNMTLISEGNININLQDDDLYKVYNDYIVVKQGEKLNCYDANGNIVWQRNILAENSLVYLGNDIIIGDKYEGIVYAIGIENEKLWEFDCKQPIEYIDGDDDRVVIFTVPSEKVNQAMILDNKGKLLVNITVENEVILLYKNSSNKKYFAISTMDLSNMNNKIKLYSSDGSLIWDRIFEDQFINSIDFIDKDGMLITTDKKLLFYNYKNQLIWKRNIGDLLKYVYVDNHSNNIYVLYQDGDEYLETIDFYGRTKLKITLDESYDKIRLDSESNVYIVGEKSILGFHNNNEFLNYHSDVEINEVTLSNKKLIIFTTTGIGIMRLSDS